MGRSFGGTAILINKNLVSLTTNLFTPKHKNIFNKCWWTQEIDVLEEMAISSCRAWKDAGKPKHDNIFQQYTNYKLLYKNACLRNRQMRQAFLQTKFRIFEL
jgi:hypothetical protein